MSQLSYQQMAQAGGTVSAKCTAAKTTYGDAAGAVLLDTVPAGMTYRYDAFGAMPQGTLTATQVIIWRSTDGVILYPIASGLMSAYTLTQTSALPMTAMLKMDGTTVQSASPVWASGGDSIYASIGVALAAGVVVSASRVVFKP